MIKTSFLFFRSLEQKRKAKQQEQELDWKQQQELEIRKLEEKQKEEERLKKVKEQELLARQVEVGAKPQMSEWLDSRRRKRRRFGL